MINGAYTILFVLSFIMLVILISQFGARISINYIMLFCCVLISNFGYMQLSDSNTLRMAIIANQTVYLGGCFAPYYLLMCISDLCKERIHKFFKAILFILAVAVLIFVSSVGSTTLYYKNISLISVNGVSILDKEYGPMHTLYPAYLFIVCIAALVIILKTMKAKRDVSYITSVSLLLAMMIMLTVYVVQKSMHLKIEMLPWAYVVSEIIILILVRRISLFNVMAISADSMRDNNEYGFLIFDSKGRFLGSDNAAKYWFSELGELQIDVVVNEENTDFLVQIGKWTRDDDENEIVYFERDNCIIEAKHEIIRERKTNKIHCVYLRDDTRHQKYTRLVEQYNENLERDVNAKTEKIRKIQNDIIISMASIVENRDNNTGGHIARTSDVVRIFVNHLQEKQVFKELTPEIANCIITAAPLHDFGKIAIPDSVLNKPGKFTDEEYKIMKKHSAKGAEIVDRILMNSDDITFKTIAVNIAHYHHEKWDGRGYPEGLSGTDIPFEARVMALADVFDALVSKRVYKERFDYDKAFSIIEESGGSHFDPDLCKEFLECREQLEALYDNYDD